MVAGGLAATGVREQLEPQVLSPKPGPSQQHRGTHRKPH